MSVIINGKTYIPKPIIRQGGTFGESIKKSRKNAGETLEETGLAVGTSKGHIWQIENGRTEPGLRLIKALLEHFGLRFEDVC